MEPENEKQYLKVEEVALRVGVSVATINGWYRWARANTDHEYALKLPQYVNPKPGQPRLWTEDAIDQLKAFRALIPHGRAGFLGRKNSMIWREENGKS